MIQTVENGTDRRFLPLVLFEQYDCTSHPLNTLRTQITVI